MSSLEKLNNINYKENSSQHQREKDRQFKKNQQMKKKREFNKLKLPEQLYKKKSKSIQDTFEIRKISPDGVWQVGEDLYSKTFLMEDLNYCMMSYKEALVWFDEWCRVLNSFDLHLCKITIFNNHRDMEKFKNNTLYQHKVDNYNMQRDCYNDIIMSKILNERNGIEQTKYLTLTVKRSSYNDAWQSLNTIEAGLIKEFLNLGTNIIPLNSNRRFDIINKFFKIKNDEFDINKCIWNGNDWRNDLASDYIDFSSDPSSFLTENKCYKALYIEPNSYPDDELADKMFDELINKPSEGIITVDIIPINQTATKNAIEMKYMSVQDKIRNQQKKRNDTGAFSSEISYPVQRENEDTKEMLDDITINGQKMFWVGINVVIAAEKIEQLDMIEDELNVAIEKYECYLEEYNYRQREALYTTLPIGGRYVNEMRSMFTRMCGILIPFKAMEMSMSDNPLYYGVNKETKNLILCNRKKLINGNGFVLATSGAGKSLFVKFEQGSVFLNYLNDSIIVLDPTGEYRGVANSFNGTYIDVSPNTKEYFNPLHVDIKNVTPQNIKSIIIEKSTIMCGICERAMEESFSSMHRSIIDRVVKIMFEQILTTPVEQRKVPILSDFYEILKNQIDEETHEIVLALEVFISGSMNIFNHQNNVDINNRYQVFGLTDLRDSGKELEGVGMLVILSFIMQKIKENAEKGIVTWLYVDEFHILMNKRYSKEFLINLWKMVRKLGGICTGITQNISDIVFDNKSNKLLSNSEYTLFLKLGNGETEQLEKIFEGVVKSTHFKYCQNAAVGNGIIRFGNKIIPVDNSIPKDTILYDIFNTNFYEKISLIKSNNE